MNLYWIDNFITLRHYANLLSILCRQIITELVGLHFSLKNCGGVVVKFTSWTFRKFLEARREQTFSLPLPLFEILLWIVFGHLSKSTGTVYCLTHDRIKCIYRQRRKQLQKSSESKYTFTYFRRSQCTMILINAQKAFQHTKIE